MAKNSEIFSYDVMDFLRKHPERNNEVMRHLDRAATISKNLKQGKGSRSEMKAAMNEIIPLSGFNFGMLIPTVFPRYPLDAPLKFTDRPFMFAMSCLAAGSVVTLRAGRQVGKCTTGDTEVDTNRGTMTMRDLFDLGVS